MKTYVPKAGEIERHWYAVDATGKTLGRLASDIARVLRGKHKPSYTPNDDVGDFVVVTNAGNISVTGNKLAKKTYYRHSGYPGGLREMSLEQMLAKQPERVIQEAVRGMLPNNSLGASMLAKLKVYAGSSHPHEAQRPHDLSEVFEGQPAGARYTSNSVAASPAAPAPKPRVAASPAAPASESDVAASSAAPASESDVVADSVAPASESDVAADSVAPATSKARKKQ